MSQVVCSIMTESIHLAEWIKWKGINTILLPQKTASLENLKYKFYAFPFFGRVSSFAGAAEKYVAFPVKAEW